MKKLYISQPMKDLSDEQILAARERAIKDAKKRLNEEVEVIDSFFAGAQADPKPPLWFLSKGLELLSEADVAYFIRGWANARGCKIEHLCATEYGIPTMHETDMDCTHPGCRIV